MNGTERPNILKVLPNDNGYPLLPSVDFDNINPANARCMLKEYIEMAWSTYQNPKSCGNLIHAAESSLPADWSLIPSSPAWDILNDPERREKVLTDTDTNFPGLKSLDPVQMNISNLFSSILNIKNAQDEGRPLLKFTFQDEEIVELDDSSPKSRPPSRILSQKSLSSAIPPKRTCTKVPDFSPERLTATSSARAAPSLTSIDPMSSLPLAQNFLPVDVSTVSANTPEKRKKRKTDVGDDVDVHIKLSDRPAATKRRRIEKVIPARTSSR